MVTPTVAVQCGCGAILRCPKRYHVDFKCPSCSNTFRLKTPPHPPVRNQTPDPYTVLGVRHGSSSREIRRAYLSLMSIYHPDKVAHLAPEHQAISQAKSRAINEAYRSITNRINADGLDWQEFHSNG